MGGKSFVFFRTPRPDAVDPETGERYDDVVMLRVGSEADTAGLVTVVLHDVQKVLARRLRAADVRTSQSASFRSTAPTWPTRAPTCSTRPAPCRLAKR